MLGPEDNGSLSGMVAATAGDFLELFLDLPGGGKLGGRANKSSSSSY